MPYKKLSLVDYNIIVGGFTRPLNRLLSQNKYSRIFILVDENTGEHCLKAFTKDNFFLRRGKIRRVKIIHIKSGEINKNLLTCQQIWQQLLRYRADRKALFINLGGGVIGDMGGFVAATYKRGIDFIQIPTTLLAQVDASIGGKLGIDFQGIKNTIGCFSNPKMVCIDPVFLQTLPQKQLLNGFAEVIKHALIANANYWQSLQIINKNTNLYTIDWQAIIWESLVIKQNIVEQDPFEKGVRKVLNFGHTIGHAIETFSLLNDKKPLLHGEAVIVGIVSELFISVKKLLFNENKFQEILSFLKILYPKYQFQKKHFPLILNYLKNDKKNEYQKLNFTLLKDIGNPVFNQAIEQDLIEESLNFYRLYF